METKKYRKVRTDNVEIGFGKHRGQLWTRLPVSYLRWIMQQERKGQIEKAQDYAGSELERRGTDLSIEMEITPHAINKCSLRHMGLYRAKKKKDEGIYTFILRMASFSIEKGEELVDGKRKIAGVTFCFDFSLCQPVLKTVF